MTASRLRTAGAALFGKRAARARRDRIRLDLSDTVVYAVGDVHGCHGQLRSLEDKIVADAAAFEGQRLVIIMLGDYVDRGTESALVLEHLIAPPPEGFERICLAGNHEEAMLGFLSGDQTLDFWLANSAAPTLFSYGIDADHLMSRHRSRETVEEMVRDSIPEKHVRFLQSLPVMAYSERFVFVHAGIRPGVALEDQDETDLTTIRSEFFDNDHLLDRWVVHGHTPIRFPRLEGKRLNIDTGAVDSGRLTAVRIIGKKARLLFS